MTAVQGPQAQQPPRIPVGCGQYAALLDTYGIVFDRIIQGDKRSVLYLAGGLAMTAWVDKNDADEPTVAIDFGFPMQQTKDALPRPRVR